MVLLAIEVDNLSLSVDHNRVEVAGDLGGQRRGMPTSATERLARGFHSSDDKRERRRRLGRSTLVDEANVLEKGEAYSNFKRYPKSGSNTRTRMERHEEASSSGVDKRGRLRSTRLLWMMMSMWNFLLLQSEMLKEFKLPLKADARSNRGFVHHDARCRPGSKGGAGVISPTKWRELRALSKYLESTPRI